MIICTFTNSHSFVKNWYICANCEFHAWEFVVLGLLRFLRLFCRLFDSLGRRGWCKTATAKKAQMEVIHLSVYPVWTRVLTPAPRKSIDMPRYDRYDMYRTSVNPEIGASAPDPSFCSEGFSATRLNCLINN